MTNRCLKAMACCLLAVAVLTGCAQRAQTPYAQRYSEALERYPGSVPIDAARIDAFVRFFSTHDATDPADLYADALYFSDTLLTSEHRDAVLAHLDRMRSGAGELRVTVLDRQVDGADVYLIWRMHARFTPLAKTVESDTLGMTHLRYDSSGRIVLQQDFWDSAEGFYQHVPVVGALVRAVGGRFATPEQ